MVNLWLLRKYGKYIYLNGHHHHHHHYQSSGSHLYCIQALEACHLGDHLHIQKKYVSRVSSAGLNGNAMSDFPTEIPWVLGEDFTLPGSSEARFCFSSCLSTFGVPWYHKASSLDISFRIKQTTTATTRLRRFTINFFEQGPRLEYFFFPKLSKTSWEKVVFSVFLVKRTLAKAVRAASSSCSVLKSACCHSSSVSIVRG